MLNPQQKFYEKMKRLKHSKYFDGAFQCPVCHWWYAKLASHTYQVHNINAKELKIMLGKDTTKGLISEKQKEKLRQYNKKYYDIVVKKNLIQKGKKTRYIKGDKKAGNYIRSVETMDRLRHQDFTKKIIGNKPKLK